MDSMSLCLNNGCCPTYCWRRRRGYELLIVGDGIENLAMDTEPGPEGSGILLQADLNLHPKKKTVYNVQLNSQELRCTPKGSSSENNSHTTKYSLKDIVGCDCMRGRSEEDTNAYLTIYVYPHKRKFASRKTFRTRQPVTLTFDQKPSYSENARGAEQWRIAITALLRGLRITNKQDLVNVQIPSRKKLLVMINPYSGPGKALQIFQQRVVPILAESGRHYITCITKKAGHAAEVVQALKLDKWAGIVIVSGDGLIFEVINGLMSRPDWEQAIQLPLGAIPGGSGNALCCSINHYCNEPYLDNFALHSSFIIAKHRVEPMDLVAVDTIDKRLYSFLSITWGVVADIDIESEKYRTLGSARFTVGAIARIVNLRRYHGRLSYLPADSVEAKVKTVRRRASHTSVRTRTSSQPLPHSQSAMALSRPRASSDLSYSSSASDMKASAESNTSSDSQGRRTSTVEESTEDGAEGELEKITVNCDPSEEQTPENGGQDDVKVGAGDMSQLRESKVLADSNDNVICNGDGIDQTEDNRKEELSNGTTRLSSGGQTCNGLARSISDYAEVPSAPQVSTPLLRPLDCPVPEDWVVLEDEFLMITATYQTHIGPDAICSPDTKLADGLIDLQFVRSDARRSDILSMFLNMESSGHLNSPDLERVKVKAFRLEPYTEPGNLVVDGESVTYGPIQAQVMPGIARIMVT